MTVADVIPIEDDLSGRSPFHLDFRKGGADPDEGEAVGILIHVIVIEGESSDLDPCTGRGKAD